MVVPNVFFSFQLLFSGCFSPSCSSWRFSDIYSSFICPLHLLSLSFPLPQFSSFPHPLLRSSFFPPPPILPPFLTLLPPSPFSTSFMPLSLSFSNTIWRRNNTIPIALKHLILPLIPLLHYINIVRHLFRFYGCKVMNFLDALFWTIWECTGSTWNKIVIFFF